MIGTRLRQVCLVNPPKTEVSGLHGGTEVSFFPMEAIGFGSDTGPGIKLPIEDVYNGFTYFAEGDVLVAKITPSFENGKGGRAIGLVNGVGFGTTELHVLRPLAIDGRYLNWLMLADPVRRAGEPEMRGAAGQQRVPDEFLRDLRVSVIDLIEQRRIADFLDTETARIDALIEAKQQLVRMVAERHEAKVETVLRDFDWVPLRRIATRIDVGIAEAATHAYADTGVPLIRSTNIRAGRIDDADLLHIEPWFAERNRSKYVLANDILTVRTGSAGVSAVVPDQLHMSQVFTQLITTVDTGHSPQITAFALNSARGKRYFGTMQWGTAQANISVPLLGSCPVPFVPEPELNNVLTRLKATGAATAASREALDVQTRLLAEYRQALITAAVTGQIDEVTLNGSRPLVDDVPVEVPG